MPLGRAIRVNGIFNWGVVELRGLDRGGRFLWNFEVGAVVTIYRAHYSGKVILDWVSFFHLLGVRFCHRYV